jgi:hypothetical protein
MPGEIEANTPHFNPKKNIDINKLAGGNMIDAPASRVDHTGNNVS